MLTMDQLFDLNYSTHWHTVLIQIFSKEILMHKINGASGSTNRFLVFSSVTPPYE